MSRRDDDPLDRLRELIEALNRLSDADGPFDVEFDYDVDVGLGDLDDEDRHPAGRSRRTSHPRFGGASGDPDEGERPRTVDVGDAPGESPTYHVDVEETADRVEIRADLPGVEETDLSVEIENGDVLVVVDGETVHRVPTEWAAGTVEEVTFNNGVLFVGLEPADATDRDPEDTEEIPMTEYDPTTDDGSNTPGDGEGTDDE